MLVTALPAGARPFQPHTLVTVSDDSIVMLLNPAETVGSCWAAGEGLGHRNCLSRGSRPLRSVAPAFKESSGQGRVSARPVASTERSSSMPLFGSPLLQRGLAWRQSPRASGLRSRHLQTGTSERILAPGAFAELGHLQPLPTSTQGGKSCVLSVLPGSRRGHPSPRKGRCFPNQRPPPACNSRTSSCPGRAQAGRNKRRPSRSQNRLSQRRKNKMGVFHGLPPALIDPSHLI